MNYSKTVNLPKSDFPMKANLPNREPEEMEKIDIRKGCRENMRRNLSVFRRKNLSAWGPLAI